MAELQPLQIADATYDRLQAYGNFSAPVIERVSEFAGFQAGYTDYHDFFNAIGLAIPSKNAPAIEVRPQEHEPSAALVVELPHANALDANQLYGLATIAGTNPGKRVVAFANPSGPGRAANQVDRYGRQHLRHGVLRAFGIPRREYFAEQGIETTEHYGYSGGVEKVFAAAYYGETAMRSAVLLEPASSKRRSLAALALRFGQSNADMKKYVAATNLPAFHQARGDSVGLLSYALGLLRPTNIAAAGQMAWGEFEDDLRLALLRNPELRSTVAWGTKSRLIDDQKMLIATQTLNHLPGVGPQGRCQILRFDGQSHAMANDVHLQAAVVLEGLTASA